MEPAMASEKPAESSAPVSELSKEEQLAKARLALVTDLVKQLDLHDQMLNPAQDNVTMTVSIELPMALLLAMSPRRLEEHIRGLVDARLAVELNSLDAVRDRPALLDRKYRQKFLKENKPLDPVKTEEASK